jgi:hypothetical protein
MTNDVDCRAKARKDRSFRRPKRGRWTDFITHSVIVSSFSSIGYFDVYQHLLMTSCLSRSLSSLFETDVWIVLSTHSTLARECSLVLNDCLTRICLALYVSWCERFVWKICKLTKRKINFYYSIKEEIKTHQNL